MLDRTPPDSVDMRRIALRALVVLACVVAIHCGDSNPTSPDAPSGGGGGGGGRRRRWWWRRTRTSETTDSFFDDSNWDDVVETYGAGGSGGGGHLSFNGQTDAGYRQVTINVNSAGSGSAAQVAVFAFKRGAVYFPSTDGAILSIDYSESSINQGGGNGQYSAPAIRQNGKLYTLVPGGKAFTTPETSWTNHSLTGLDAERLPNDRVSCGPPGLLDQRRVASRLASCACSRSRPAAPAVRRKSESTTTGSSCTGIDAGCANSPR